MGKFSIPDMTGKPKRITISIAKAEEFNGKDDQGLMELAREKALAKLKKHYPSLFL